MKSIKSSHLEGVIKKEEILKPFNDYQYPQELSVDLFPLPTKNLTESATYQILQNQVFNFMNDIYPSVSSTTFNRILNWAKDEGISKDELLSPVVEEKLNSSNGKRFFFSNDEFLSLLEKLYINRGERFQDFDIKDFFTHVGYSGGTGFENFALDKIFPLFFGKSLRDVATYSSLYSAHATRQRNIDFSQESLGPININSEDMERISINVSTFPGISTNLAAAALYQGYVKKVLDKGSKISTLAHQTKFNPVTGSFSYSAVSSRDEAGTFDWRKRLEKASPLVNLLTSPIVKSKIETENRQETLENIISTVITGISKDIGALKRADKVSGEHNIRVGRDCLEVGALMGLSRREMRAFAYGAPQHDFGKTIIPQSILLKKGGLKAEEFRIMQEHTTYGAYLMLQNGFSMINEIFNSSMQRNLNSRFGDGFSEVIQTKLEDMVVQGSALALFHQEFANGEGYPTGLTNNLSSRISKIIQVIDFNDAFGSKRPYKSEKSFEDVNYVLKEEYSRGHFDLEIGDFLINDYFHYRHINGISQSSWSFDEKAENGFDMYEQQVIGAIRGNVDLEEVYPPWIIEKAQNIAQNHNEIYYSRKELESIIENHLVGFHEDVKFQERLRLEVENNPNSQYNSLKKGRVFDVYSLTPKQMETLRYKYPDEILESEEHLRCLDSRIHYQNLLDITQFNSLEKNQKYKLSLNLKK